MSYETCSECGETYDTRDSWHPNCPGSPSDRASSLEERVAQLEDFVFKLSGRIRSLEEAGKGKP